MNQEAISFAKQQEELIRRQLGDLYSGIAATKDSSVAEAEIRKQNLLNRIEQGRQPIEQQFQVNTKGAYANRMLAQQSVDDMLNRMNLSNSGFSVGERVGVDTAYGRNLTDLMTSRSNALRDLENQKIGAEGEHAAALANIDTQYAGAKLDIDKYINERATSAYDKAYQNYTTQKQIEWEQKFKQSQLNAQIAQANKAAQFEREKFEYQKGLSQTQQPQNYKNIAANYYSGQAMSAVVDGNRVKYRDTQTGSTYDLPIGTNPWTGKVSKDAKNENGDWDPSKVFASEKGGYQPNNINGQPLKSVKQNGKELKVYAPYDPSLELRVHQVGNSNRYAVWNAPAGDYMYLTDAEKKELGITRGSSGSGGSGGSGGF